MLFITDHLVYHRNTAKCKSTGYGQNQLPSVNTSGVVKPSVIMGQLA